MVLGIIGGGSKRYYVFGVPGRFFVEERPYALGWQRNNYVSWVLQVIERFFKGPP